MMVCSSMSAVLEGPEMNMVLVGKRPPFSSLTLCKASLKLFTMLSFLTSIMQIFGLRLISLGWSGELATQTTPWLETA